MSEVSNINSILQENLLLNKVRNENLLPNNNFQTMQSQMDNMPSVLDKETLTRLRNGEFEISLQQYTTMNTYNTMMNSLYGNNSADKFQNTLNILTNSSENDLATAKSFIEKMRENGMSNKTAVRTYTALQKYSIMSSFGKYNFVSASV